MEKKGVLAITVLTLTILEKIGSIFGLIADKDAGVSFFGGLWINYVSPILNINLYHNLFLGQLISYIIVIVCISYLLYLWVRNILIKDFYKTIDNNQEYFDWHIKVFRHIYGDSYLLKLNDTIYPCFKTNIEECDIDSFKLQNLNFDNVVFKDKNRIKESWFVSNERIEELFNVESYKWIYKVYRIIVGNSIKYPNLTGFMLDKMNLNNDGICTSISCKLGTYKQNVFSSHIIEYETYLAYKRLKDRSVIPDNIIDYMPLRKQILLASNGDVFDMMHCGHGRFSLLSVQLMIVYYDTNKGEYCTLLKKRASDKIAAKLGYLQLVPAGGFELYEREELCYDIDKINDSYTVKYAVYRELLEELFNIKTFEGNYDDGENRDTNDVIDDNEMIGIIKKHKFNMHILGITTEIVSLRSTLSCLIRIDDPNFRDNFVIKTKYNEEFDYKGESPVIQLKDIENKYRGNIMITPDSVAMYALAKESKLYQEIVDNDYKLIKPEN